MSSERFEGSVIERVESPSVQRIKNEQRLAAEYEREHGPSGLDPQTQLSEAAGRDLLAAHGLLDGRPPLPPPAPQAARNAARVPVMRASLTPDSQHRVALLFHLKDEIAQSVARGECDDAFGLSLTDCLDAVLKEELLASRGEEQMRAARKAASR